MDVKGAHATIEVALAAKPAHPRLMCSFGKDSLVMVDLLAEHGIKDVLFIEDTDEILDLPFIEQVKWRYDLTVTKVAPGRGMFFVVRGQPLFLAWAFLDRQHMTPVPTNITPGPIALLDWTCMTDKLSDAMRWETTEVDTDLVFSGFKLSDIGKAACKTFVNLLPSVDIERMHIQLDSPFFEIAPGLKACAPLIQWTDEDVWTYIRRHDVPWSGKVYDVTGARRPHEHVCCFRCHDPRESSIVACPKTGGNILNTAALTQDTDLRLEQLVRMGVMTSAQREELTRG